MQTEAKPQRHKIMDSRRRERELIRRALEREAVEYEARKYDADWFPLMAGYRAAERGCAYDRRQPKDWRTGWSLWHRRQGRAA